MTWRTAAAAAVLSFLPLLADNPPLGFPDYTPASVVDAASGQPALAPNSIGSVYGTYLASGPCQLVASDVSGGVMPTGLGVMGVTVLVGSIPAGLYYVSPTQINFLVPSSAFPGKTKFQVIVQGRAGPEVTLNLTAAAPDLFLLDPQTVIASNADGAIVTSSAPAHDGDVVVLYAEGLGPTAPAVAPGEIPTEAARIVNENDMQVLLDGVPAPEGSVLYAGVALGFAGLYQINLRLPPGTSANPEIRVTLEGQTSPAGVHLPVQP